MSSSINPNNINGNYPIAGQDNDSQGFRDNFTNIKNNLTFAKTEIEDLQAKSIIVAPLNNGQTPTNNMSGAPLVGPKIRNSTESVNQAVASSGVVVLDYALGHLHYTTVNSTSGNIVLSFVNWPSQSHGYGKLRLYIDVVSTSYTLTLPTEVSVNVSDIEGSNGQIITFPSPGKYLFEFSSYDGGTTIIIQDLLRNYETQLGNAVSFVSATITGNLSSSTLTTTNGNLTIDPAGTSDVILPSSTELYLQSNATSTSTTTGALVVTGGVGIAGTLSTGGAKIEAGYQYSAPTTGFNITANTNVSRVIFDPAGTLANGTITLPNANVDATTVTISSTQNITAFQVLPNSGTTLVPSANITLTGGSSATYFYHANETKWYKIG